MTTPFIASRKWELSNVQNDSLVLLEPLSQSVSIPDTFVALEYLDHTSGIAVLNRDCNIALEQQDEDKAVYEEGISGSGRFDPNIESQNQNGTYKRLLYNQIYRAFYNNYTNPVEIFGMENIDFPLSKTNRVIADDFRMFSIPRIIFGDKILESSIEFFDNDLDDNIKITDDGNENLIASTNLFSKIQEVRSLGNNIITGSITSSYCS